jgi:hypothetical protein
MTAVLERTGVVVHPTDAALGADVGGVDLGQELRSSKLGPTIWCCAFAASIWTTTS